MLNIFRVKFVVLFETTFTDLIHIHTYLHKMKLFTITFILVALLLPPNSIAGPLAYGICQTGCNAVVVACYAAAGFTFGTVTAGLGTPAAIIACNSGLGLCMAGCIAAGFAPTL